MCACMCVVQVWCMLESYTVVHVVLNLLLKATPTKIPATKGSCLLKILQVLHAEYSEPARPTPNERGGGAARMLLRNVYTHCSKYETYTLPISLQDNTAEHPSLPSGNTPVPSRRDSARCTSEIHPGRAGRECDAAADDDTQRKLYMGRFIDRSARKQTQETRETDRLHTKEC